MNRKSLCPLWCMLHKLNVASRRDVADVRVAFKDDNGQAALDLLASNHFSQHEPGVFAPILDSLLQHGDYYFHLADLKSYADAQARAGEMYADQEEWTRKAILNIAASGKFSSDRTIAEYARTIWGAAPCPIP